MADKVLLLCDKYYISKVNFKRSGVGWDTMIIRDDMVENVDTNKYIYIMREKDFYISFPKYMRTKYALHCPEKKIQKISLPYC